MIELININEINEEKQEKYIEGILNSEGIDLNEELLFSYIDFIVLKKIDESIGYIIVNRDDYIVEFVIDCDYRKKGIGKKVIRDKLYQLEKLKGHASQESIGFWQKIGVNFIDDEYFELK